MPTHYYFKSHRIQTSEVIISLVLSNEKPLNEKGSIYAEWIGNPYQLRDDLDELIQKLEEKYHLIGGN